MSDPTRFDLNDRQRAMLAEMGVRVWWPQRTEETASEAPAQVQGSEQGSVQGQGHPATAGATPSATAGATPSATAGANSPPMPQANPSPLASRPVRPGTPSGLNPVKPVNPVKPANASAASSAGKTAAASAQALAPLPAGIADMDWPALQEAVNACQACALCSARKTPILGSGHALPAEAVESATATATATANATASQAVRWMVVGDSPLQEDDQQGQPFTGPEGQLLDNMLMAVGVRRQTAEGVPEVSGAEAKASAGAASAAQPVAYLTHAVKCRPVGRNPDPTELATCAAYLSRQVALVQPHIILAMGRFAIQSLLGSTEPMGKLRGRVHDYQGVPVVVTFPPDALLRNAPEKAKAWEDLVLALGVVKPR